MTCSHLTGNGHFLCHLINTRDEEVEQEKRERENLIEIEVSCKNEVI